ncbi:MAG: energy-coupling factor transporter ATPase [Bacillota bacterium]|nr:energy-coupling factor transporter ATPase [Bacillota bacterium]
MSILINNLNYIYMSETPYEKTALSDINIKINEGEFVGIIGHTGSGKSTLIQHFNGILKPTIGKVTINGLDISKENLKEIRRQVGIVFQYPEHQLFEDTVYNDIGFGLKKLGMAREKIEEQILSAIELIGLDNKILHKSPFELSGGQKRKAAIAGVIAMKPKILVLDEPAAGLDPVGREEIYNAIINYRKENNATVILVSHNMEDLARLAQRIIVLNEGKIEMEGTVSEIFKKSDVLEKIGLSVPQITYFMKGLKKYLPDINDNVYTIKEAKEEILNFIKKRASI